MMIKKLSQGSADKTGNNRQKLAIKQKKKDELQEWAGANSDDEVKTDEMVE